MKSKSIPQRYNEIKLMDQELASLDRLPLVPEIVEPESLPLSGPFKSSRSTELRRSYLHSRKKELEGIGVSAYGLVRYVGDVLRGAERMIKYCAENPVSPEILDSSLENRTVKTVGSNDRVSGEPW